MGKTKWEKFRSKYNTGATAIAEVHAGSHNTSADWTRLINTDTIINGTRLSEIAGKYNNFNTDEDVRSFFQENILHLVNDDIDKDQCANYLLEAFHQGGLMYPVSSPLQNMMHKTANGLQAAAWEQYIERHLVIISTESGFAIQEDYTSKRCLDTEGNEYLPDDGQDFVIKACASVDVNFSRSEKSPSITITSNEISFGNTDVESKLADKRNFIQVMVDFFKIKLGLSCAVNIITVSEKQGATSQQEQPCVFRSKRSVNPETFDH